MSGTTGWHRRLWRMFVRPGSAGPASWGGFDVCLIGEPPNPRKGKIEKNIRALVGLLFIASLRGPHCHGAWPDQQSAQSAKVLSVSYVSGAVILPVFTAVLRVEKANSGSNSGWDKDIRGIIPEKYDISLIQLPLWLRSTLSGPLKGGSFRLFGVVWFRYTL